MPTILARDDEGRVFDWKPGDAGAAPGSGGQGPTGETGAVGEQGPPGEKGPTGDQGPQGLPGPQGAPGPDGNKGATGDAGPRGEKGETGDAGAAGAAGAAGSAGPVGDKGPTGDTGQQGPVGDKGATGDKGLTGDKGPVGDKGPTGDAGAAAAPVYAVLANGATAMDLGTNTVVKVTPTANATYTTTVPAAGHSRRIIVLTSGTTSRTITFGSGFKPTGTLATGTTSARVFVLTWVSDGSNLYEASRTAAMVA